MTRGRYQVEYPPSGWINVDGGKNNKFEPALISDAESPDCLNVRFGNGSVETRGGTDQINTISVGSYVCDGLYTHHGNDGSQTMCAWYGGSLYTLGTTTLTTVPSAQSIYTAGERVGATEYENYIFFGNGYSNPYKYHDGYFTRQGIPAPESSGVSVVSDGTGGISADVQYQFTYVNSALAEGNPSTLTTTLNITAGQVTFDVPTAPASYGVISRRIYRSDDGATAKRVAEISDNSTTTYTDNITSLGANVSDDNDEPPKWNAAIFHQGRIFTNDPAEPGLVKYSDAGNPYVFPAANFKRAGDETADIVRGFYIYQNSIVVWCDTSVWLLYMPSTDDSEWQMIRITSRFGCKSPYGAFGYDDKVVFPAMEADNFAGYAEIKGGSVNPSATLLTATAAGSFLVSDRIEPDMFLIQRAYVKNISSIVYKNRAYTAVTYGNAETLNNRIYVFDFSIANLKKKQAFSWSPDSGINPAQFAIYGGDLYFGSSSANGLLYKYETSTYNDVGSAINSYWQSKEFTGQKGDEKTFKDFRYLELLYEKVGDYFMDLFLKANSDVGSGNKVQVDLNPGGSLWGSMRWGLDLWGGGETRGEYRQYLGTIRGNRLQFKISNQNTTNQRFKIIGAKFVYNNKGRR